MLRAGGRVRRQRVPLYVLNVTYPLIDAEVVRFCAGKRAVLVVEEGQPEFIEQAINTILRRADIQTRIEGKGMLPMAGEYTGGVVREGVKRVHCALSAGAICMRRRRTPARCGQLAHARQGDGEQRAWPRPPSFCTGCPERPIFTAMKLVERELGPHHVSCDIGCHLFSILPPFNIGATTMGYGLGGAGASAFNTKAEQARDRASWATAASGTTASPSSVGNAVFNKIDNVQIIVDNGYTAATGGQDILSSRADNASADQEHDREGGARRRRRLGAHDHAHLRRRQDARHAARGADHQRRRARRSSSRNPNAC